MEDFYKSLSDAEWEMAEAIESEIGKLLRQGFTKPIALKFVRTVLVIRKVLPDATVEGIFDRALNAGLAYLGDEDTLSQLREPTKGRPKPKRKSRVGSKLT